MATEWLNDLESTVERAAAEIERLRAENERLQRELAARHAESGDGEGEGEAWAAEREEIRARVERLVETLEGLLEE